MLDGIYYYYYLLYTKIIKDNQIHSTVVFVIELLLGLIINGILNIYLAVFFKYMLAPWMMLSFGFIFIFMIYLKYYRSGRGKRLVKTKILNIKNLYRISPERCVFYNQHCYTSTYSPLAGGLFI